MIRTYSNLISFPTFKERYDYLRLGGKVGEDTFGWERYLNQKFYRSTEWRSLRNEIIIRDNGCDLGLEGYEIGSRIYIHHMNPINVNDIEEATGFLFDPENLICVSFDTHQALHYGLDILEVDPVERCSGDTKLW